MQQSTEYFPENPGLFCSAVIPTVGRATLTWAVESVLQQELAHADFEVLVVNDSGTPLPEADWQKSPRVQVIHTNRRERSVARNTGAALSRGTYLHFLDDDDWLAPGAYQHFWQLSQSSSAKWLYGMTQLMDRENRPTIKLGHGLQGNCFIQAMAGEWIPLQSSLIEKKAFLRVGGFNPLLSGPEDIDLLRRFLLEEDLAETPHHVACVIMGGAGSTTNYQLHPQASRWAREKILDAPRAFQRMRQSAGTPVWKGRMLRIYLTSTLWNLKQRQPAKACSRAIFSAASLLLAGASLGSTGFWRSVAKPYASVTFEKGLYESQTDH
jgi:glycosyltransferase involved in cell wall biosynthesis